MRGSGGVNEKGSMDMGTRSIGSGRGSCQQYPVVCCGLLVKWLGVGSGGRDR